MAHTEARIDFGEEQLEDESMDGSKSICFLFFFENRTLLTLCDVVARVVRKLKEEIEKYLDDGHRGEIVRDGIHIAIMGAPNAGKSSLMNILGEFLPMQCIRCSKISLIILFFFFFFFFSPSSSLFFSNFSAEKCCHCVATRRHDERCD
jgi:hypothetical protein